MSGTPGAPPINDLTAQRDGLLGLGVEAEPIYGDHGVTGTNRELPGLHEALAGCAAGSPNSTETGHLVSLVPSGEYSTLEVAELFDLGRSTVYRAINRQRVAAKAEIAGAPSTR